MGTMADPATSVLVHVTPRTTISVGDTARDGDRITTLHLGNEVALCFCDDFGDVGLVAVLGEMIDRLEILRRNARGRMAAGYADRSAWSESEMAAAWGR